MKKLFENWNRYKIEIEEAKLPDTMGAGYGDPQDDEHPDAMGPRVPHEFQLTGKWEKDLAGFIRNIDDYLKSLRQNHSNPQYDRRMEAPLHTVRNLLKSRQDDLGKDLPVRRHGQDEPIDPTKYVEAPTEVEQKQMMDALNLVGNAFSQMVMSGKPKRRGKPGEEYPPVDYTQLKKDIQSAIPHGGREYWSAKGGKSKQGGGYEYDPAGDTPTYFESLQKNMNEDLEVVLTNEEAAEMFGDEVLAQIEEAIDPSNVTPENIQLAVDAIIQVAKNFAPLAGVPVALLLKQVYDGWKETDVIETEPPAALPPEV